MSGVLMGECLRGRYRRSVVLGMSGALVASVLALGGPAAQGSPHRQAAAAGKVPAGSKFGLTAVTAVPHSQDLWTLGSYGSDANMHYRIARRHGGHFKRVHPPSYGGRYGLLRGFAAASPKAVWAFGARQIPHDIQDLPAIWRLSGKKWVRAKLPAMQNGVAAVTSMSASSPTNAWAVGSLYALQPGVQYALHWNGKKWVGVPEPAPFTEVSTLGPKDAWAVAQTSIYHWDGATWSLVTTAASNVIFNDIAMSSPRLGYAVGAASTDELTVYTPVMMRFNGKKWTKVSLKRFPHKMSLTKVAVHGKSAWTLGVTSTNHALILHTSGGAPKAQQTLGRLFRMAAISAASTKHAYAVGTYGYKHARSYFEALHGNHWKAQSSNF